eukprot:COSAG05_NODE_886_length_6751_cov_151.638906_8_plen_41_part_00
MSELGFRSINEMVGHSECLEQDQEVPAFPVHISTFSIISA